MVTSVDRKQKSIAQVGGPDRQLHRVAGGMAVVGTTLMIPLQAMAASVDEPGDIASYFVHVLGGLYQEQYLAIGAAALVMAMGMAGMAATLRGGPGRGWATIAMFAITLGGAVAVLTGTIAAIALVPMVEAWETSGQDPAAFAVASAVWWLVRAGFVAFVLTLLGAGVAALGLAVAGSSTHPSWLGWMGAAIGFVAMAVAILLGLQGPGVNLEKMVFPVVAMAAMLWILTMGVLTWRRGGAADAEA